MIIDGIIMCDWCESDASESIPFTDPGAGEDMHLCSDCTDADMPKFKTRKKVEKEMVPYKAKSGFKFGCDPEVFVRNADGVFVPPVMIPGSKVHPHPVTSGAVQRDGMAAEFNIDPAETFEEFDSNIATVMEEMKRFLPAGYSYAVLPTVTFDKAVFDKAPDDLKELGCQPDFNAWTGQLNQPPNDPENPYMRSAAGHIHIGWTEDAQMDDMQHILNCNDLVKQCDWYLGAWSARKDPAPERRRLYGKAGACRYKNYGVEYRVLSNFWITSTELRMEVWNRLQAAISDMANYHMPDRETYYNSRLIQSINHTLPDLGLEQGYHYPIMSFEKAQGVRRSPVRY